MARAGFASLWFCSTTEEPRSSVYSEWRAYIPIYHTCSGQHRRLLLHFGSAWREEGTRKVRRGRRGRDGSSTPPPLGATPAPWECAEGLYHPATLPCPQRHLPPPLGGSLYPGSRANILPLRSFGPETAHSIPPSLRARTSSAPPYSPLPPLSLSRSPPMVGVGCFSFPWERRTMTTSSFDEARQRSARLLHHPHTTPPRRFPPHPVFIPPLSDSPASTLPYATSVASLANPPRSAILALLACSSCLRWRGPFMKGRKEPS